MAQRRFMREASINTFLLDVCDGDDFSSTSDERKIVNDRNNSTPLRIVSKDEEDDPYYRDRQESDLSRNISKSKISKSQDFQNEWMKKLKETQQKPAPTLPTPTVALLKMTKTQTMKPSPEDDTEEEDDFDPFSNKLERMEPPSQNELRTKAATVVLKDDPSVQNIKKEAEDENKCAEKLQNTQSSFSSEMEASLPSLPCFPKKKDTTPVQRNNPSERSSSWTDSKLKSTGISESDISVNSAKSSTSKAEEFQKLWMEKLQNSKKKKKVPMPKDPSSLTVASSITSGSITSKITATTASTTKSKPSPAEFQKMWMEKLNQAQSNNSVSKNFTRETKNSDISIPVRTRNVSITSSGAGSFCTDREDWEEVDEPEDYQEICILPPPSEDEKSNKGQGSGQFQKAWKERMKEEEEEQHQQLDVVKENKNSEGELDLFANFGENNFEENFDKTTPGKNNNDSFHTDNNTTKTDDSTISNAKSVDSSKSDNTHSTSSTAALSASSTEEKRPSILKNKHARTVKSQTKRRFKALRSVLFKSDGHKSRSGSLTSTENDQSTPSIPDYTTTIRLDGDKFEMICCTEAPSAPTPAPPPQTPPPPSTAPSPFKQQAMDISGHPRLQTTNGNSNSNSNSTSITSRLGRGRGRGREREKGRERNTRSVSPFHGQSNRGSRTRSVSPFHGTSRPRVSFTSKSRSNSVAPTDTQQDQNGAADNGKALAAAAFAASQEAAGANSQSSPFASTSIPTPPNNQLLEQQLLSKSYHGHPSAQAPRESLSNGCYDTADRNKDDRRAQFTRANSEPRMSQKRLDIGNTVDDTTDGSGDGSGEKKDKTEDPKSMHQKDDSWDDFDVW